MLPDDELVTWLHCGHRYELILTRLHPERYDWQPTCGAQLRSGLEQYEHERAAVDLLTGQNKFSGHIHLSHRKRWEGLDRLV
jgi:hypothetical protein